MTKARLMVTKACGRDCSYCCNKYDSILKGAVLVSDLVQLPDDTQEIMITGGEPMLNPQRTIGIIKDLKRLYPKAKIFMYTALYDKAIYDIIPLVDGIQYTIHEGADWAEVTGLALFQEAIKSLDAHKTKSFRMYVYPKVDVELTILPHLWKRVEVKAWLEEGECDLPEGETLYIIRQRD